MPEYRMIRRITRQKIEDRVRHGVVKPPFVTVKEVFDLGGYDGWCDLYLQVNIFSNNPPLAARQAKFAEPDPERNNADDLFAMGIQAVTKKVRAEVPPSVGEQHIELGGRHRRGVEMLIDKDQIRARSTSHILVRPSNLEAFRL